MKPSMKTGFSFGLTSGIITTLGLIVGLNAGTHSKTAVIGGILTIAIADAFSDALGIHVSQESQNTQSDRSIWEATVVTFLAKLVFSLTFIIPVLLLKLDKAVFASVIWGFSILAIFSFIIAKGEKKNPKNVVIEHLVIGLVVIFLTNLLGNWIAGIFN